MMPRQDSGILMLKIWFMSKTSVKVKNGNQQSLLKHTVPVSFHVKLNDGRQRDDVIKIRSELELWKTAVNYLK